MSKMPEGYTTGGVAAWEKDKKRLEHMPPAYIFGYAYGAGWFDGFDSGRKAIEKSKIEISEQNSPKLESERWTRRPAPEVGND